jgi:hypothetical protein
VSWCFGWSVETLDFKAMRLNPGNKAHTFANQEIAKAWFFERAMDSALLQAFFTGLKS